MTHSSDHQLTAGGLSETSQKMLSLREAVFEEWEAQVRKELPEAEVLQQPMLLNSLPAFYNHIAESVTPDYPPPLTTSGNTLAAKHGAERARLTAYDHQTLIGEYQIFRWAIFDVLCREGVQLGLAEVLSINLSIDAGIKDAVNTFATVHTALRERFAAALTHDLRAPLGTIATALELILHASDLAKTRGFAGKALSNVQRMESMLNELLDTMAFHSGEQLSLQLSKVDIYEVINEFQANATGPLGPRLKVLGSTLEGWWDRTALRRAVENLVTNAYKYGKPDTPITIKMDELNGCLLLSVHNEGNPISLNDKENIFQMYVRTTDARRKLGQGWGIGLPYVRAVAESHGGNVTLDSSAEYGTTFTLNIPLDCRSNLGSPGIS